MFVFLLQPINWIHELLDLAIGDCTGIEVIDTCSWRRQLITLLDLEHTRFVSLDQNEGLLTFEISRKYPSTFGGHIQNIQGRSRCWMFKKSTFKHFHTPSNSSHINSVQMEAYKLMASFNKSGRAMFGGGNFESYLQCAIPPTSASASHQVQAYSTATGLTSGRIAKSILFNCSISTGTLRTGKSARTLLSTGQHRSYSSTNPSPPSGARNASVSSDRPARVALIG